MRKNVVAAQPNKFFKAEQSLCNALREYVDGYDRDQGRARTLMPKCWQSMQSRVTKSMNLEKRLGGHTVHSQESGLVRRRENEWSVTNNKPRSPESQPKMEGIVYLVTEWISLTEMTALQSACCLCP